MLGSVLEWLDSAPISLGRVPVTWAEILGDVTGAACVWLVAKQNVWNWPLGLANNVFWALLFFRAKLYADASLQVIFFVLGCYGWWRWTRPSGRGGSTRVGRTSRRAWSALVPTTVLMTSLFALLLSRFTDSPVPLADASVLTLSLAATWGQAHRLLESWWIWILVDVISVPLYLNRGLYPTAVLYAIFGLLCVKGLRDWTVALKAPEAAE
ncbi:MAG: nicotinamide riboside transporter PnuC [Polyangiaceae bacterium]